MVTTVNDRELRGSDFRVGISAQLVKDAIDDAPVFIPVRRTEGKTSKVIGYTEDPSVNSRYQAQEQVQDTEDLTAELSTVFSKQSVAWLIQAIHAAEVAVEIEDMDIAATATGFTGTGFSVLQVGDGFWVEGFSNAAIDGFYIVESASATEISTTIVPAAAEAAGEVVTITTKRSLNADSPTYSAIQTQATDLSQADNINYHTIFNAIPNTFSLEIGETGIVTATTAFMAEMEAPAGKITGQTYASPLQDRAVTSRKGAQSSVRAFYVDDQSATCKIKSLSLEVNNNYQKDDAAACEAYYARGAFQVSGSAVARSKISNPFVWRDKSWNADRASIGFRVSHGSGDETYVVMRRNVITEVTIPDGNNVVANTELTFVTEENFATETTIEVYRNWQ